MTSLSVSTEWWERWNDFAFSTCQHPSKGVLKWAGLKQMWADGWTPSFSHLHVYQKNSILTTAPTTKSQRIFLLLLNVTLFYLKYQPQWARSEIPEWNNSRMKGRRAFKVTRRKIAIFQSAHEQGFTDTLTTRASISLPSLFNLICWWDQAKPSYSFCSLI